MPDSNSNLFAVIACGGTGGHLFPGLAVAEALQQRGCAVTILVSSKEVDQRAVKNVVDMEVQTLPAVALERGSVVVFVKRFWESYRAAKKLFQQHRPQAVLAMGGFTSAPPILAAKACGAATFIHEANSIPGRANRWLARWVRQVFVFFPACERRVKNPSVAVLGMPVRPQFQPMDAAACRLMLGLDPQRPVLLVMGGSQGASAINDLIVHSLPLLSAEAPELQYLHLTGLNEEAKMQAAYARHQCKAVIRPFLTEMELAMNAATAAVSRAGASSLAEAAALRLPMLLIPYPSAANNHQFYNALAFVESGASRMVVQKIATPEIVLDLTMELMRNEESRAAMRAALGNLHKPLASEQIADRMLAAMKERMASLSAGPPLGRSKGALDPLAANPGSAKD
jgi:UDP-N-acetylglucosamine--N-acetylmuramyl-(pentapeptide) pyrophosphoryl-undecaprenol N-acetylglucosamine transferase